MPLIDAGERSDTKSADMSFDDAPRRRLQLSSSLQLSFSGFLGLAVLFKDVLVRSTLSRYIRVVVPTQDIRSAVQWVMANPPTPLGVAIDLTDTGVHPDADRTDERRLTEVGTEAGPEVVVQIRPSMERSGVKCQPMSYDTEERSEEGNSHHEKKEEEAKSQPPRLATDPGFGVDSCPAAVLSLGQRS